MKMMTRTHRQGRSTADLQDLHPQGGGDGRARRDARSPDCDPGADRAAMSSSPSASWPPIPPSMRCSTRSRRRRSSPSRARQPMAIDLREIVGALPRRQRPRADRRPRQEHRQAGRRAGGRLPSDQARLRGVEHMASLVLEPAQDRAGRLRRAATSPAHRRCGRATRRSTRSAPRCSASCSPI